MLDPMPEPKPKAQVSHLQEQSRAHAVAILTALCADLETTDKPHLVLRQISDVSKAQIDMMRVLGGKSPKNSGSHRSNFSAYASSGDNEEYLEGVENYGSSFTAAPGAETFGATILREVLSKAQDFVALQPSTMRAITVARKGGNHGLADALESRVRRALGVAEIDEEETPTPTIVDAGDVRDNELVVTLECAAAAASAKADVMMGLPNHLARASGYADGLSMAAEIANGRFFPDDLDPDQDPGQSPDLATTSNGTN